MIKKFIKEIYKKLSFFFVRKTYGRIKYIIKSESDERIEVKNVKMQDGFVYKLYKILNGRLYTDRVRNAAVIIDNTIVEGPSFQLRDNSNAEISNNIVITKGTPRILKKIDGVVASLLTGGGGNNNYFHWMYDVLPRLKLCEQIKKLDEIDFFILPSIEKNFQKESLKELKISPKKFLSSEEFRHVKTKELIVTDHPYTITNNFHKDSQNIPLWIFKWLKEKFLKDLKYDEKNYPKRFFIDRNDSKSKTPGYRSLINADEVKKFLVEKNFSIVKLAKLSFIDQVKYFNNAECIVGIHDAGFANMAFCKENTKIIVFETPSMETQLHNMAKKNNLNFDPIISKPISSASGKQSGSIKIPIDLLEKKF